MAAGRPTRTVDAQTVITPLFVARPATAWNTRVLAFLCFPMEWEDRGPCTVVEFEDAKAIVEAFDMDDPDAVWPAEALAIMNGDIRYCAYTSKFYRSPQWRTPVGPRIEADVPHLDSADPSLEDCIAHVRALEAFITDEIGFEEEEAQAP